MRRTGLYGKSINGLYYYTVLQKNKYIILFMSLAQRKLAYKTATEKETACLIREDPGVCDHKALLLMWGLEAELVAAWLGRCLQEKCLPHACDKERQSH